MFAEGLGIQKLHGSNKHQNMTVPNEIMNLTCEGVEIGVEVVCKQFENTGVDDIYLAPRQKLIE